MTRKQTRKQEAKWIFEAMSKKGEKKLVLIDAYCTRTKQHKPIEEIQQTGYWSFQDLDDMKETLNWCFNGDPKKYCFKWTGQDSNGNSFATAEVYD